MASFQWHNPGVEFAEAQGSYSGPTSMFLASMQAGLDARLKMRQARAAEQAAIDERERFERMMAERAEDNARDQARINQAERLARDRMGHEERLKREQRTYEEERDARLAVPDVVKAAQTDPTYAAALAASRRVQFNPFRPDQPMPPMEAPAQPQASAPQAQAPALAPETDDPERDAMAAAPVVPPMRPPVPPQQPKVPEGMYEIRAPGLSPIIFSGFAAADAARAQRQRAAQAGVQIVEGLRPAATTPFKQQALAEVMEAVRSGALPPDKDAIYEKWMARAQHLEDQANSTARSRMAAANRPKAGVVDTQRGLNIEQEYWDAADKTFKTLGGAAMVKDRAKLEEMAGHVAGAAHNAALASVVAGGFTKYAQGGSGVISDADLMFFWQKLGGIAARTKQSIENLLTGNLTPDIQEQVDGALKQMVQAAKTREIKIGRAIETRISSMQGGRERVGPILKTLTPGYYNKWVNKRAKSGDEGAVKALEDEAADLEAELEP